MKKLIKKQKLITLLGSVVLVCGLAVGTMFITGVLPTQAKGMVRSSSITWDDIDTKVTIGCCDPNCPYCHTIVEEKVCGIPKTVTKCGGCRECCNQKHLR